MFFGGLCMHFEPVLGWKYPHVCMSKELKTKELTIKSQNINQAIDIQLTTILEIKLQKYIF